MACALAINLLLRAGVPSGDLSEEDLAGEEDSDNKFKKKVVSSYALLL